MENNTLCYFKEIILNESSFASIYVIENNIYVLGEIDINHPVLKEEIDDIQYKLFEEGRTFICLIYSSKCEMYNIYKEESDDDILKGLSSEDFRNLELGTPDLPDFNSVVINIEDYCICE